MAGDWIKMRGCLSTHPNVLRIAALLEIDPDVSRALTTGFNGCLSEIVKRDVTRDITLASLMRVWCAANEHTEDGIMRGIAPNELDQIAGVPGFGAAMESVGWAQYDEESNSTIFPNFLEHNVPAKRGRSEGAERQKRYRDRKKAESDANSNVTRNVTSDVTSNDRREEKREERKPIGKVEIPEWVPRANWDSFVEMRRKGRSPFTDQAQKLALSRLSELRDEGHAPAALIDAAVLNGWKSFYPPKATHAAVPADPPWKGAK